MAVNLKLVGGILGKDRILESFCPIIGFRDFGPDLEGLGTTHASGNLVGDLEVSEEPFPTPRECPSTRKR